MVMTVKEPKIEEEEGFEADLDGLCGDLEIESLY